MDRRSQSSLTHRIVTEVLGLSIVAGALALGTAPGLTVSLFGQGLAVYAVFFVFSVLAWWQIGGMAGVGIFRNNLATNLLGMLAAFAQALLPVFLRLLLTTDGGMQEVAAWAMPACFALVSVALALMIRTGNVYQSKRQWRLVHHSLWIAGALFAATIFIPMSASVLGMLPVRVPVWLAILALPLIARRMGVSLVATPAKPPSPRPLPMENSHSHANDAGRNMSNAGPNNEAGGREEGMERRPPRRGHYRHRRQGGSRRRV